MKTKEKIKIEEKKDITKQITKLLNKDRIFMGYLRYNSKEKIKLIYDQYYNKHSIGVKSDLLEKDLSIYKSLFDNPKGDLWLREAVFREICLLK